MNNQSILYGIIGLLAGMVIVGFTATYAVNHNSTGMMNTFGMHYGSSGSNTMMGNDVMDHSGTTGDMSMNSMVSDLRGRTGDDFDKVFLADMISHHQGAINMAKEAQTSAKHQEIKDLAGTIITAQTGEINQMQAWQKSWGY